MRLLVLLSLLLAPRLAAQHHARPERNRSEQLGTVRFATSCNPATNGQFNRAVALLHSFEFGLSTRAFREVLAKDSTCAMAYWGIALNQWTNPFLTNKRPPAQLQQGREAVERARALLSGATDRERAYVEAVAQLYTNHESIDQATRVANYERAMRALAQRQPPDMEATIFHAIALVASAPSTDKTFKNQLEAGQNLQRLFAKHPEHPGLAHYIIHSYDVPPLAAKAESAATRYAMIAPSSSHALHMPSHTFTRVGWWAQSVSTNLRSIERAKEEGSISQALHAADYAAYAYLQMGRDSAARAVLESVPQLEANFDVNAIGAGASGIAGIFAIAAIPARFALERRAWREAAALQPRSSAFPWTEAMTYFARALGASRVGDLATARASSDSLASIHQRLKSDGEPYWAEQVAIQWLGASAWLALAEGHSDSALAALREAAAREDATEKSAVTPGPLAPARELLGDMLMELGRPADALREYRQTLQTEPNRFRALYGAMRAARASGDTAGSARYTAELRALSANADRPGRSELRDVRGRASDR